MKKQYIQPNIKTVKIDVFNLLAGSPNIEVDDSITGGQYPPEEGEDNLPPITTEPGGGDGTNFGS